MQNHDWRSETLWAFKFVQEYELKPVLAFRYDLLIVGMPKPAYWVANNDNEAKS